MIWLFSSNAYERFYDRISSRDWSNILKSEGVNIAYNVFADKIQVAFNNFFPLVKLSRKRAQDKKWITAGLKRLVDIKQNFTSISCLQKLQKLGPNIKNVKTSSRRYNLNVKEPILLKYLISKIILFDRYKKRKGKVFPYSLPSVGPGADPGVQAVSPQVT